MPDLSFVAAMTLAMEMGDPPEPLWLGNSVECIRLVELVQMHVVPAWVTRGTMHLEQFIPILTSAFTSWAANPDSCPDVQNPDERKNILLRLWAGCVGTGKMVALETRNGMTTQNARKGAFTWIDATEKQCPIFRAGVTFAIMWKEFLGQEVCFDGVPADSVARKFYVPQA